MLIYGGFSKKCHAIFKKIFLLFWNFWSCLVCVPSFKSINSSCLSRKKYERVNFTPIHLSNYEVNTSVGIGLIELTKLSGTLNHKQSFKYCILQTNLDVFLLFTFVCNKIFCSNNWAVFYIFLIWFGLAFGVTVLKVLCFWCCFYKVIGN